MVMDARKNVDEKTKEQQSTDGTLYCAGMIAGEGLVGILLAIFAVFGINTSIGESVTLSLIHISGNFPCGSLHGGTPVFPECGIRRKYGTD